jgi:hypothetical protein
MARRDVPSPSEVQHLVNAFLRRQRLWWFRNTFPLHVTRVEPFDDGGFFRRQVILSVWAEGDPGWTTHLECRSESFWESRGTFAWDGERLRYLNEHLYRGLSDRSVSPSGLIALSEVIEVEDRPLAEADPRRLVALVVEGPLYPLALVDETLLSPPPGAEPLYEALRDRIVPPTVFVDRSVLPGQMALNERTLRGIEFTALRDSTLAVHHVYFPVGDGMVHQQDVLTERFWRTNRTTVRL